MEFTLELRRRAGPNQDIAYGGVMYDTIWILALALNKTLSMVAAGNFSIAEAGCENSTGSLVPLEEFLYSNEMMGCLMQWNIQQTNFSGVSVSVSCTKFCVKYRQYYTSCFILKCTEFPA